VAALEDVHGVDLQQVQPVDQAVQLSRGDDGRAWPPESLGGEGDAALGDEIFSTISSTLSAATDTEGSSCIHLQRANL
jgi:hypothetical protein